MKRLFLYALTGALFVGCEVSDDVTVRVKHKAAVYLKYRYDNGETATLDDIHSMRLFIYDEAGRLYRDTLLPLHGVLGEEPVLQTYLTRGRYTFVSWANVGDRTAVEEERLNDALLGMSANGADRLLYGRFETPIVKGDSLRFDIDLFKSVFKVNVRVEGLQKVRYPENHYFAIENREALDFYNRPSGEMKRYRPALTYDGSRLAGSFYTPYFTDRDNLVLGVWCDHPDSPYERLCEMTIRDFASILDEQVGRDVEIDVLIEIGDAGTAIVVSDWNGVIAQQEVLGNR
ncbi:MAG: FimB/Mfa2 family fimbrial subunit [Alistipes senegalensis]|nr:FimB/Mfa2 family fimbrial subunit [Bacteroides cellulosilyticus]MCM1351317.1 FimB/Mfa2 family fimbrial subunit [Alistipes senegalensis]